MESIFKQANQLNNHMEKNQLQKLLTVSDAMTADLLSIKTAILNGTIQDYFSKPTDGLIQAASNRKILRTLAETIEANRNLVQLNKEKIERSKVFLEGLEYYKTTLKSKILEYHIEVESIDDYLEEPLGQIDWENNHTAGEELLKQSLQSIKHKNQHYQESVNKKNQLSKLLQEKKKLFNETLPKQVTQLNEEVISISKLFGVEVNEMLEKIKNPKLAYIFDDMKTLMRTQNIEISYVEDQYEYLELSIKPTNMQFYSIAAQNKLKLEEKELKLTIVYLSQQFGHLAIGIDRRSDYTNQQVFNRLINNEQAKPLFEQASSEAERNLNSKYVYVQWLEDILCSSAIQSTRFLQIIRERIFCLNLTKNLLENIKKLPYYSPYPPSEVSQLSLKKLQITNCRKVSFLDFKEQVKTPSSIAKYLNNYQISKLELLSAHQSTHQSKGSFSLQEHEKKLQKLELQKNKLGSILKELHLEELITPNVNSYYRINLEYYELKISLMLIIPFEYPKRLSQVKIISLNRDESSSEITGPAGLECKAAFTDTIKYGSQAQTIEKEVNKLSSTSSKFEPFNLLFQINRLFTVIGQVQYKHHHHISD